MSNTLKYILDKYNLKKVTTNPIEIPNVGRNDLAKWLNELDFKVGVEIGVAAGEYSEILCCANPQMQVYGVDPWEAYSGYRDYTRTSTFSRLHNETLERMMPYNNYTVFQMYSLDALSKFKDNMLDFVYIDANHSEPYVSQDIREWYKKVRSGGILAGHDYARIKGRIEGKLVDTNWQVKDAVQRIAKELDLLPWFIIGAEAKIPGTIRDNSRSWMFIKP